MKLNLLFSIIFLSITSACLAGGTELYPLNGAKTLALNGLHFAGFDGVVSSTMNPASLIFVENNGIEFSMSDRLAQNKFEGGVTGLYRSLRNDEYIINGGIYFSLSDNLKLGLSYQPTVNYNVEWPYANNFKNDTSQSMLVFDYFNRLKAEAFSATAAIRFDNLTLGIAPVVYRITLNTSFPKTNTDWTGIKAAGYQFAYSLDGWAYGFTLGAITQLTPETRVALSIRSGYSSDIKGSANSNMFSDLDTTLSVPNNVNVTSKIKIPWIFGAGALYTISPEFTLNVDAQYSLWGSVQKSIDFNFNNSIWQQGLSVTDQLTGLTGNTFNLSYRNTFDFGAGLEYIPEGDISYRFGYRYSQSPNNSSTYNMLFPSVDQHWLSAGFGLKSEDFILDGTVAYGFSFSKSISGGAENINGKYSYSVIIPSVSLKYLIK